jgi:hypothetical protein
MPWLKEYIMGGSAKHDRLYAVEAVESSLYVAMTSMALDIRVYLTSLHIKCRNHCARADPQG